MKAKPPKKEVQTPEELVDRTRDAIHSMLWTNNHTKYSGVAIACTDTGGLYPAGLESIEFYPDTTDSMNVSCQCPACHKVHTGQAFASTIYHIESCLNK